jgi:hypothetical protein
MQTTMTSYPATPEPSTGVTRNFSRQELALMRRNSLAQAAQLKLHLQKELRASHSCPPSRRTLNKLLDVILLVEEALGIDAEELLQ